MKNNKKGNNVLMYAFLILSAIVFFFPFYFLIISITNNSVDITQGRLLPGSHTLENFRTMIETTNILQATGNSAIVAIIQTLVSIFLSSLAGYGFEIHQSRAKEVVYNIILLSMMIPFAALMVPLFRMFGLITNAVPSIGIDTLTGVMLPNLTTAFLIFFFRQNTKMFPRELLEAGRMDGLTELGLFLKIYMPTMKNAYAAAGIVTFMNAWNNFMWPLIILQSPSKLTIPVVLSAMGSGYSIDYGVIMIAIFITTIPTGVVFFVLQKHFVQGMMGSIK